MKAKDLIKKERPIKDLYEEIEQANKNGQYKIFIPHFVYVSESTKAQLLSDGYKLQIGQWNEFITDSLIIEW